MPKPKLTTLAAFTLLELLVVIGIMGILVAIGFGSFTSSQVKARDARRKADLENIARALEMYYNDKKAYPVSGSDFPGFGNSWPGYMEQIPNDSRASYAYERVGTRSYRLYARLENREDKDVARDISDPLKNPGTYSTTCGAKRCNYVITSTNLTAPAVANGDY